MEFLERLLSSDVAMSLVLVAVPWLIARAFAWWKAESVRRADDRHTRAVEALEVGVHEAWESLGRAWKLARKSGTSRGGGNGGKLTGDERAKLRDYAVEVAREIGREQGLDVLKTVGAHAVKTLIGGIIARRKRGG